jgi:hypothetical protein
MVNTINSTNPTPTNSTASTMEFDPMPIIVNHLVRPYSNAFGNRLLYKYLPHTCFRRISPQCFLVSRFVAKTWPAFRNLWRAAWPGDRGDYGEPATRTGEPGQVIDGEPEAAVEYGARQISVLMLCSLTTGLQSFIWSARNWRFTLGPRSAS